MLKKTFFQIHWFLGITAGLVLSIMGISGAIYSYDQQILKLINPHSYTVTVPNTEKLSPEQIYQHFVSADPNIKINSITIAEAADASSSINIVREGERRGYTMMINPYTAEKLPEVKGRDFFMFIMQLHRYLTAGEVGKQITGASTLMLIFFVLSGVYLRWPKKHSWKQWFAIKPKLKGRNFIWDLHAVVGTWVVVFYLIIACTGLYWSYDWWRNGMFKVMGVPSPQAQQMQNRANAPAQQQGGQNNNHAAANPPTQRDRQGGNPAGTNTERARPAADRAMQSNQPQERQQGRGRDHQDQHDAPNPEQIQNILQRSWQGFHQQYSTAYSSISFSIPKQVDGKIEISFVDKPAQHDRARNKAVYDYQQQKLQDIELYKDKKLNQKIMSSMLPVHRGSFFGPVFQFLFMFASLCMPLFFVTGWMLYLKRRKQKKLTLAARQHMQSSINNNDQGAVDWIICYASQTGVAEQLAWRTAGSLQEAQQSTQVLALQNLSTESLNNAQQILFVVSTYGTGDAPDSAMSFEKNVLSKTFDLSQLRYAVLALGSKEYADSYCEFGHRVDAWLSANGAQKLFDCIEVDNANNDDIARWNTALASSTQLELHSMKLEKVFDQWQLQQRDLLNPNSLGAPAYLITLQSDADILWQAGDIAEIQPANSAADIAKFLDSQQLSADSMVTPSAQRLADALWDRNLRGDIGKSSDPEQLLAQLPILPSREYSIASIPNQGDLKLVVRQQRDPQGELGLGSGWLTQHCRLGGQVALRIRSNPSFHLIDDNRPIICIGNGTGIAGLLSLLSERMHLGYHDNWLIFGERQRAHDFFMQQQLEQWQHAHMLKRLDLAFSRDQTEKIYVHHLLRQHAEHVKTWISNGAVIYVCGSIQGMASDVDHALIDILGADLLEQLRAEQRYRRDVY
ncbi:PepSY domain-containing protein [Acinetobacter larvae]|uniref:Sulfite reductase subunit alpha n=1 Tax=Acinetobacter larvae TaxID=1789224 RepID=A0A1B2M3X5_9GAMM|nr:sulfite reductase flavoprotein subunit alpha [Acinetobacter larvae]AOA59841.1 hypothetical protein BFG52_02930 [Acinetobacter larvae]